MQKIKSLKVFFLAALFVMAFASVAFAGAQDFILVNNTGFPIYKVNVSAASTNQWEEDILGSQILNNGESLQVNFGVGNQQYWDRISSFPKRPRRYVPIDGDVLLEPAKRNLREKTNLL